MTKSPALFSDQLRRLIDDSGQTRYAIAKTTKISQGTLSRFMSGERGLPMKTLDRLAAHLGWRVVAVPKSSRKVR
jgi:transcriptional regulator with XRE-family HTH domain